MARAWTIEAIAELLRQGHVCVSRNELWGRLFEYEVARDYARTAEIYVVRGTELRADGTVRHAQIWAGRDAEFAARTFLQHAGDEVLVDRARAPSAKVMPFPSLAIHPQGPALLNGKGAHR